MYIITKLELGGAQKVCLSLFKGIATNYTTVLISGTEGPLVEQVTSCHNSILLPQLKREVSGFAIARELKALIALVKTLRKLQKKYDHIIVHTHSTKAGILGRWAAWIANIPHRIHTIHGYAFHEHQPRLTYMVIFLIEWITSFITTQYVCVSSYDATIGVKSFPRFKNRHTLIRAAVEADRFITATKTNWPTRDLFVFGTVACFKPQKNLFDLLRAFKLVHSIMPHARLEIIGDGIQRQILEAWINEHDLCNVITLHGWQQDVAAYMRSWHAFVLSSLWEGLPCALVEARMQKLPVVCYNTGGISDIIIHKKNGLLCTQRTWQELAHNMLIIIQQPQLYAAMSQHNDDLASFENRVMVEKHVELYSSLMLNHTKN